MIHTWFWLPFFWLSGRVTWYTLWQCRLYPPVSAMSPTLTPFGNLFLHSDSRLGPAASHNSLLGVLLRSKSGGTPLTYTSTCKHFVLFTSILYCVVNIRMMFEELYCLVIYAVLYISVKDLNKLFLQYCLNIPIIHTTVLSIYILQLLLALTK